MMQPKAVDRICRLRGLHPGQAMLSILCKDLSQLSEFAHPIDTPTFRLLKKNLPGPFTFVLHSDAKVPKLFRNRKRTIGVRIPDHAIPLALIEELGNPMLTTSLKSEDEILEYYTDPGLINEDFGKQVDLVVDGGTGGNVPSTLVFCLSGEPEIIRQGAGELVM